MAEVAVEKPAVDIDKFLNKVRRSREAANQLTEQLDLTLVRFNGENAAIDFNVDWSQETVWGTQQQIADAFGVDRSVVTRHIGNIYDSGELERSATSAKFALNRLEGGRQVTREVDHFNLDVILSVGYRVSSVKATAFRKWATDHGGSIT